jgi:hypothetical protein
MGQPELISQKESSPQVEEQRALTLRRGRKLRLGRQGVKRPA